MMLAPTRITTRAIANTLNKRIERKCSTIDDLSLFMISPVLLLVCSRCNLIEFARFFCRFTQWSICYLLTLEVLDFGPPRDDVDGGRLFPGQFDTSDNFFHLASAF